MEYVKDYISLLNEGMHDLSEADSTDAAWAAEAVRRGLSRKDGQGLRDAFGDDLEAAKAEKFEDEMEEGKMCEHHNEEEFPKELLEVELEKVLDLMSEQSKEDEEISAFYDKFEAWLKSNAAKLSNEEEADEEDEEEGTEEEKEVEERAESKMDEASQELPYRITKRIPGKLLRINFTSDWGGEASTLIFNSDKEGTPVKEFMTKNYEWTEDGDEVKMATMKGGQLVGNTPSSTKIIEDLARTFGNIDKVYVRQIAEGEISPKRSEVSNRRYPSLRVVEPWK